MPVSAFGFEIPVNNSFGHPFNKFIMNDDFIKKVVQKISLQEIFIFKSPKSFEVFVVSEHRETVENEFYKFLRHEFDLPLSEIKDFRYHLNGAQAIAQFFQSAIGLNQNQEINPSIEEFRRSFAVAREAGLIGDYFNKLYQRGLWLAEKVRIELNLQKNAMTPESVVTELAQKIFGDLSDHKALIASDVGDCESFVKKLQEKNIGELLFVDTDNRLTQELGERFSGRKIAPPKLGDALREIDLILLFNENFEEYLRQLKLGQIMDARKNAPLLYVTYFDSLTSERKKNDFIGHYNVYSYDKDDLSKIVASNLREHQKVTGLVENQIDQEVENFVEWVNSNERYRFGNIIGKAGCMQKIMELVARIAPTDISVLIDGESGTGKELIAKAIHEHSMRVNNPFVVVNCGAMPENLLESELFGHVRGAFTGATNAKKGLFEVANHGTIFLDEIGETSLATQVKLLRFLQEGEIKPVGSNQNLHLDVRVITATNRDLEKMIADGTFRQDLFYRLNVIQITIPPLRDRMEDVLPLAHFFVKKYSQRIHKSVLGLDPEAENALMHYIWPGNVRELENVIERAVALCSGNVITKADLPPSLLNSESSPNSKYRFPKDVSLKELEKIHIATTLREHNWNYDLVTKILGIGRTTLWRKMKEYNISNGQNQA